MLLHVRGAVRPLSETALMLCLAYPMPTWEDYVALSFDEIRQFGALSAQVVRRLRSALIGLADSVATQLHRDAVRRYPDRLDIGVGRFIFDEQDRASALQEDRQGLGPSRKRKVTNAQPTASSDLRRLVVPSSGVTLGKERIYRQRRGPAALEAAWLFP